MTLYLFIAAYLSCAVLSYGVLCGLAWSEQSNGEGWTAEDTRICLLASVLWPLTCGFTIGALLCRSPSPGAPFRLRLYFRSRKPASRKPVRGFSVADWVEFMLQHQKISAEMMAKSSDAIARETYRTYGPPEGTVAHKMRTLSEDAEKLRGEKEAVRIRKLKLDALNWAVDTISHKAKEGCCCFELDGRDPWIADGGKDWVALFPPGPGICVLLRGEVLPFLAKSLGEMGFRVEEVIGIGELYGITHIRVEW